VTLVMICDSLLVMICDSLLVICDSLLVMICDSLLVICDSLIVMIRDSLLVMICASLLVMICDSLLVMTRDSLLLRMRTVSDKSCRESKNKHFMSNNYFSKNLPFVWENFVKPFDRPRMTTSTHTLEVLHMHHKRRPKTKISHRLSETVLK
jgi:hypothetical protein